MSCARFLSFAALCLGLASFAASSRAAQPDSDYDLEPLLRRYSAPSSQVTSSDNDVSSDLLSLGTDNSGASDSDNCPHYATPASYEAPAHESRLCEQQEPALLPLTATAPTRAINRNNSDWTTTSVRVVKQASASGNTYGPAANDDMTPFPMPNQPGSRTAQTTSQSTSDSSSAATRAWVGDGNARTSKTGNVAMNAWAGDNNAQPARPADTDNSPRGVPEAISAGCASSDCNHCCDGDNCCDGDHCCCDDDCFNPCGCCGWFGGADYLLVRPDFSEAQAFVRIAGTPPATITNTIIQQKYDYRSSVRAFFGYRTECGDEIRFTYWNFSDGGTQTVFPSLDVAYGGQFMLRANLPGDSLTNSAGLNMNVYDIDYVKCCCNPCPTCNPCCPVWTLSYSAGVRIADYRRTDNTFQVTQGVNDENAFINTSFIGAGPRLGIEGRRYFRCHSLSLFARGNLSLLLGELDAEQTLVVLNPGGPNIPEHLIDNHDRIIPVADIEIGGDYQLADNLRLSAGYLFQAWWDLGQFEQVSVTDFLPNNNSNILGFDGLFARIEYCF